MDHAQPPPFQQPGQTVDLSVKNLLNDNELYVSRGIDFSRFVPLKALERDDLIKDQRVMYFYYKDVNAFVCSRRIFLELEWYACLEDDAPLTLENAVSATNPMSQTIIDSCTLNIGETALNRTDGYYPYIAKMNYLTFSPAAKETFLKTFEKGEIDTKEKLVTDISTCFKDESGVKVPLNSQGRIAKSLLAKQKQNTLIQLHCPLQQISQLIPR